MRFTKMHGAGNDFIIINNIEERIPEERLGALAKQLCAFHTSIGADGHMPLGLRKRPCGRGAAS